jgi:hypothetical protein
LQVTDPGFSEPLPTERNRLGIAVDAKDLRAITEQGSRVTTVSQRSIDCPASSSRGQTHLLQEHRHVIYRSLLWHLEL